MSTTQLSPPSKRELVLAGVIDAPAEKLSRACTEPGSRERP